jgi:hypothetical protein
MRYMKVLVWVNCAIVLGVSLSEAGRFRAVQSGCSDGQCATSAVQLPAVEPLPADTEVATARGWPWSKPPAPAPQPTPAPVPAPVVTGGTVLVEAEVSAEVRRPIVKVATVPVRALGALVGAVRNREHKPVVRAVRVVKAVVGRERRVARRGG